MDFIGKNRIYISVICMMIFTFTRLINVYLMRRMVKESVKVNESSRRDMKYIQQKFLNYGKLGIPIRNSKAFIYRGFRENGSTYYTVGKIDVFGYLVACISWMLIPQTFFISIIIDKIFSYKDMSQAVINNIEDFLDNTYYYKVPRKSEDNEHIGLTQQKINEINDNRCNINNQIDAHCVNKNEMKIETGNTKNIDNEDIVSRENNRIIMDVLREYIF